MDPAHTDPTLSADNANAENSPPPARDDQVRSCAAGLRARVSAEQAQSAARADALRERAEAAARRLCEVHGATRVWLFGSLAWGEPHESTDVDLLVEGVAESDWLNAGRTAEEVVCAPVDVVRLEDAPPSLRERVRADGVVLYAC